MGLFTEADVINLKQFPDLWCARVRLSVFRGPVKGHGERHPMGGAPACARTSLHKRVIGPALLVAASLVPYGTAWAQAAGAEWTTPAGTVQGTRFSSLSQISASNVAGLTQEFQFVTEVKAGHQGAPLVVGNTMYVVGPFPNRLFALDLTRPGQTRWIFSPRPDEFAIGEACCDIVNRGPVFSNGKVIYNALDNTTVAVNAVTGQEVWRTKLGDPRTGQTMVMGPLVVGDKVFVGNSGAELGVRGWLAALSVDTGREVWRAWGTGPDADVLIGSGFRPFYPKDQGTNLGVSTWPGTLWKQGGGTRWGWLTYDPQLNLLFEGTSNPAPWNPDIRPGDNKWSSTIFARNPDTGQAIWAYQTTPHDAWDYDTVNENIVVDLPMNGAVRQLIVHFNKNGFAYTMDRRTGEVLVAKPFVPVNWADRIDLVTGSPVLNPAKIPREGEVTKDICPAPPGGKDVEPAAFSPSTGLFYIPSMNVCADTEPLKVNFIQGTPYVGASTTMKPGPGGVRGELIAWNAVDGTKVWGIPERFPLYSGVLATAGNLVFYGTMDRWFKAVDATTGKVLFQTQLPSGIIGSPIAFTGPDGKQRVAVYSGIGGLLGAVVAGRLDVEDPYAAFGIPGVTADLPQFTPRGGAVHVFKLP
jgi:lanthanide-dependent methanol dehydrogenase